jgi:polysaccharide pyruvyl transferase WcaK-like protein
MKRIVIWGGWSRNYGDLAILVAMKQLFRNNFSESLDFMAVNSDLTYDPEGFRNYPPPRLSKELIREINETCDLMVVGGGGQIMNRDSHHSVSGWQFNCSIEDLNTFEIPLVTFGIGYNKFPKEPHFFNNFAKHLAATYRKSELFSVRNAGTADVVYGAVGENQPIYLISDPAMFIESKPLNIPALGDKPVLGINWAGDASYKRFHGFQENDLFLDIIQFCKNWSRTTGGKILYIPHLMYYDFDKFQDFRNHLGDDVVGLHKECPWLYPEHELGTPLFVGAYKACTAVLGMRGHANILPFGQGVPAFGYGAQDKVKFFQDEVGGISLGMDPMKHYTEVMDSVFKNRAETLRKMSEKRTELYGQTVTFTKMALAYIK